MAELIGSGITPKETIIVNLDQTITVWATYVKNGNEVYVRRRGPDEVWGLEIFVNYGTSPDIYYNGGQLNLIFDLNGKIFYRFWPENELPIYLKPPGVLSDCMRIDGPLDIIQIVTPRIPDNFERMRETLLTWSRPALTMGLFHIGFYVYEINTTGRASLLTPLPITEEYFFIAPVAGNGYFITAVVGEGYGSREFESKRSNVIFVTENELWGDEEITKIATDLFGQAEVTFELVADRTDLGETFVAVGGDLALINVESGLNAERKNLGETFNSLSPATMTYLSSDNFTLKDGVIG